jgi:hypothetical protein
MGKVFIVLMGLLFSQFALAKNIPSCSALAEEALRQNQNDGFELLGVQSLPDGEAAVWANKDFVRIMVIKAERLKGETKLRELGQCKLDDGQLMQVYTGEAPNEQA